MIIHLILALVPRWSLIVHWFQRRVEPENDPFAWFVEPPAEQERSATQVARELLGSLRAGQRKELGGNHYYAMTLSGASGRIMMRDSMEGQFEDLVAAIVCALLTRAAWAYWQDAWQYQSTEAVWLAWLGLILPVAFGLLALHFLLRAVLATPEKAA